MSTLYRYVGLIQQEALVGTEYCMEVSVLATDRLDAEEKLIDDYGAERLLKLERGTN